jgi:transposase
VPDLLKIAVMTSRRAYRSDLSDPRWALVEPILAAWRAARAEAGLGLSEPVHDLREIVNAILYVNRTGIAWEYLPHDFPPFKTVYDYYAKWETDGTTEAIHDELRRTVRKAAGRSAEPSAAILDAQSIRTSGNVPESSQGIDAGNYLGWSVMPGGMRGGWPAGTQPQERRHNYRSSRKASRLSVGLYRPEGVWWGAVRARARSFMARSAWR